MRAATASSADDDSRERDADEDDRLQFNDRSDEVMTREE